jgi:hypothetical protein
MEISCRRSLDIGLVPKACFERLVLSLNVMPAMSIGGLSLTKTTMRDDYNAVISRSMSTTRRSYSYRMTREVRNVVALQIDRPFQETQNQLWLKILSLAMVLKPKGCQIVPPPNWFGGSFYVYVTSSSCEPDVCGPLTMVFPSRCHECFQVRLFCVFFVLIHTTDGHATA